MALGGAHVPPTKVKIRELGKFYAPYRSATVRRTEKSTDPRNSLALGLQRGVNSISLQCFP